jgi:hypothetical protein
MSPQTRILLIIALAVALMLASFIWFVATWDPAREESITELPPEHTRVVEHRT